MFRKIAEVTKTILALPRLIVNVGILPLVTIAIVRIKWRREKKR